MHVLVKERELEEVSFVVSIHFACRAGMSLLQHAIENRLHIADRFGFGREGQLPAGIVCDTGRIIKAISMTERRFLSAEAP
jgi:hypothetical protein